MPCRAPIVARHCENRRPPTSYRAESCERSRDAAEIRYLQTLRLHPQAALWVAEVAQPLCSSHPQGPKAPPARSILRILREPLQTCGRRLVRIDPFVTRATPAQHHDQCPPSRTGTSSRPSSEQIQRKRRAPARFGSHLRPSRQDDPIRMLLRGPRNS